MEPPRDERNGGWFGNIFEWLFDGLDLLEVVCWLVRAVGHMVAILVRAVFHLLP